MHLSQKIILWYKKNKRDLPFRNTRDAYKIWLSEIILQQTRVDQGLPYYNKFIENFPDVFSLAKAKEETVLKLWQGLGYYSRGRNLHATSKIISELYEGKFPSDYKKLLQLKGIGQYAAAAIASFAFGLPHAVVDGNVIRVLSRVFDIDVAANSTEGKKIFYDAANEILNKKNAALHNYALMELGALVCKPRNPRCEICPVAENCFALMLKKQHVLPVKEKKIKVKNRYFYYLVIEHNKKLFIKQRTEKDIWKNLFDFPLIETKTKKLPGQILACAEAKNIISSKSFVVNNVSREFKHKLSHQTIHAVFIKVKTKKENTLFKNTTLKLVSIKELKNKYALPRLIELYLESN